MAMLMSSSSSNSRKTSRRRKRSAPAHDVKTGTYIIETSTTRSVIESSTGRKSTERIIFSSMTAMEETKAEKESLVRDQESGIGVKQGLGQSGTHLRESTVEQPEKTTEAPEQP
jgi:hypothetical protein